MIDTATDLLTGLVEFIISMTGLLILPTFLVCMTSVSVKAIPMSTTGRTLILIHAARCNMSLTEE